MPSDRTTRLYDAAQAPFRDIPILSRRDKDAFKFLWAKGIPILIGNSILHGNWSPERFCATHGTEPVHIIDSSCRTTVKTTLADFLQKFIASNMEKGKSIKLKVYRHS